jgi:hypothetical protein
MRRRRWLLVGLVAVALLGCGLFVWVVYPKHRINRDSFEQIRSGMTEAEVEAVLGAAAGDYRTTPTLEYFSTRLMPDRQWSCNECRVGVWLNPDGKVRKKEYLELVPRPTSLLDRFRHLLRL